ncbi:hypothetical protein VVR12_09020 [Rothia sp. LK2588]|uniref:hypothetical protein n=1 Tax=Rothia sp. LK2588 TaxID=3114369 RepID=UPI0034CD4C32
MRSSTMLTLTATCALVGLGATGFLSTQDAEHTRAELGDSTQAAAQLLSVQRAAAKAPATSGDSGAAASLKQVAMEELDRLPRAAVEQASQQPDSETPPSIKSAADAAARELFRVAGSPETDAATRLQALNAAQRVWKASGSHPKSPEWAVAPSPECDLAQDSTAAPESVTDLAHAIDAQVYIAEVTDARGEQSDQPTPESERLSEQAQSLDSGFDQALACSFAPVTEAPAYPVSAADPGADLKKAQHSVSQHLDRALADDALPSDSALYRFLAAQKFTAGNAASSQS